MATTRSKAKTMATVATNTGKQAPQAVSQAAVAANGAAVAAKRTRTKKEDMPYSVTFLDDKNQDSERMPTTPTALKVTLVDGKVFTLGLKDVPALTKPQLEADALKRRLVGFIKDVTKANIKEAHGLIEEFAKVVKGNTLFLPKEGGGGPGRVFDYDFWLLVIERTARVKFENKVPGARLMTDKDREAMRARLESMTPDQRNEKKKEWEAKDAVLRKVAQMVRIEREATKAKSAPASDYDVLASF